jgi:hypothetical protein
MNESSRLEPLLGDHCKTWKTGCLLPFCKDLLLLYLGLGGCLGIYEFCDTGRRGLHGKPDLRDGVAKHCF